MFSPQSFVQVSFALAALCLMPLFLSVKAQNLSSPKTTLIYSISDLEVLQQANAYQEFFKHAHDILPTQRTKYWLNMVSNMAQGFIDLSVKQDNFESSTFKVVERLSSWPELRGDEFYQIKRNRYALNYFKVCLSTQKTNHCKKRMLSFWKTARKEAETGFRLLQYFAGFFPSHDSWPLLKDILTKGDGQFYCDKPLVTSITFSHLEKQHLYSDSSERIKMYLSQMASAACWKKMAVRARQHLKEAPVSETRSLFVALENTTELTPTLKNTWLVRYYLSEPAPGSLLNRAWNQLELLSNDYAKRRQVLKELLSIDPLPDELFSSLDDKKNQVLFAHFSSHFPEYIQKYSKTCMAYLEGTRSFTRGNPTIHCQKLMAYDGQQKRKKISQELHLRYSGTLKNFGIGRGK